MAFQILFAACLLGGFVFPWWWPALAGCAVGAWLPRRSWTAALTGFLAAGAAWGAAAGWRDLRNHHLLGARIAELFHLPGTAGALAVTALVGGLMGGLGAWAGHALREWIRPRVREDGPAPLAEARNAAAEAAGSESSGGTLPVRGQAGKSPMAPFDAGGSPAAAMGFDAGDSPAAATRFDAGDSALTDPLETPGAPAAAPRPATTADATPIDPGPAPSDAPPALPAAATASAGTPTGTDETAAGPAPDRDEDEDGPGSRGA
jgi:hypothetical protein